MSRERGFDAIIIGGGAMGSATAWHLAERGVNAVLIEQFEIGHGRGSSRGPSRIFRYAYTDEFYVRMMVEARDDWNRLETAAGERLLRPTGALNVGPGADQSAAAMAAVGVAHSWISGDEATDKYPVLDLRDVERVLFHPDAGVVAAEQAIRACARLAAEGGVEVKERVRVDRVRLMDDSAVVEGGGVAFRAPVVVLTAGAWAPRLLLEAGIDVDVAASSTHVAYYEGSDRESETVPVLVEHLWSDPASYVYVVPGVAGRGAKLGRFWKAQAKVDPDDRTLEVDQGVIDLHSEYVARRLPGLNPQPLASESCMYDMTPNEDFVVDRHGPVVVGAGFSGHGFKFMPLVGRLLAAAVLEEERDLPEKLSLAAHASNRAARAAD